MYAPEAPIARGMELVAPPQKNHHTGRTGIMAFNLESISKEIKVRAPHIIMLGVEKIGKTTFACGTRFEGGKIAETGINNPVVISVKGEEGADSLAVGKFPVCNTYNDILDAIASLYSEEHEFQTVVLDSVSAIQPIIYDDVCSEFSVNNIRKVSGFRTGEAAVVSRWRVILDGINALRDHKGMASVVIGHVAVKKHKNPEGDDYNTYDFDLDMAEVSELLKRWADVILFANTKVVVRKDGKDSDFSRAKRLALDTTGGQRFLFTQKRPAHPGGGRGVYGHLPYELPLDWAAFEAAVAAATAVATK